jgi:hypothetical protein
MTTELAGQLERRLRSGRTLGTLTIGQAPRSDIAPILRQHVPDGVKIVDHGLLDGLSDREIQSRYGVEAGEPVLLTRLGDGRSVQLSARKVRDGIPAKLSALEADGCDVILLLCTGQFHELRCEQLGYWSPTASFRRRLPASRRIVSSASSCRWLPRWIRKAANGRRCRACRSSRPRALMTTRRRC